MQNSIVKDKSYKFALRIINLYKYLTENKKEFVLSKQILRSGTSIGANIEESLGGQSQKDFFSKLTVAYKEARETKYWLNLLTDSKYLDIKESESLLNDCEELLKIIGSIQSTLKKKVLIRNS
jgi:four helix bundle protein